MAGVPSTEIYGPFEVLERLGIGGMATVHRAIERGIEGFERVVGLKRLLPHLAEDEDFVRAFVREAKLASLLQHGNIVKLFELGRVGTSYFISMEYIPGRDLRVVLRQARRVCGPPPVEVSLALMVELLDALDCAHNQRGPDNKPLGLVHRDISPSNLIVSHTGHLKVIDFGIAKATLGHMMTHTGRIKGKLSYMAPEALTGRLDARSDLFSASVIAHELLTATPLFAAKEDLQIIDRLQNMQPAPPSTRNPVCPPELDDIVLRGLAKDPGQRWRSAAEMRAALSQLAIEQHLLATSREVSHWVEEAFEMPAPQRLRMPLTAPPVDHRRSASSHESDDEVMDIVWGVTAPRSPMAVVLEEVPDVSSRFRRINHEDSINERLRLPDRPTTPPPMAPSSSGFTGRYVMPSSTGSIPSSSGLAPGSSGAMPSPMAPARRRSSLTPLLIAAVAVAGAGAAIGWAVSGSKDADTDRTTAALPTEPDPAAAAPAGAVAQPSPAPAPTPPAPTPAPEPAGITPSGAGTAASDGAADATGDDEDSDRARERKRKARRDAEERPRPRERMAERSRDDETDDSAPSRSSSDRDDEAAAPERDRIAAADDISSRPSLGSGPRDTADVRDSMTSRPPPTPNEDRPAPKAPKAPTTPAEPPRAQPSPARPKGPIIVAASRAHRESGSIPPIRFPPSEQAPPPALTAKLCIDTRGTVTSVTVLSAVGPGVRNAVERALSRWRYRPVMDHDEKVAACFATTFKVQVQ